MKRITPALVVCAGVMVFPASVSSTDRPPPAPYYLKPLVWKGWPPPPEYRRFIWPGHCLDIRHPDRQERYCPP